MTDSVKYLLIVLLFSMWAIPRCVDANETPDVAVWLARSCVGESNNWKSYQTGECAAILHIYKKLSNRGRYSVFEVAKKYSAAIKRHKDHPNPWVFTLGRLGTKPKKWPHGAKWAPRRVDWLATLVLAESFLEGNVPDPLPLADHYGGECDHARAIRAGWWKLDTPFKNNFYSIINPKRKGEQNERHD